ncbi:MAG: hypothetical protein PHF00_10610, partial [Elusimicrobia bacterium]|nr:hypothetical protein [Elusimicrobiota bacterium]
QVDVYDTDPNNLPCWSPSGLPMSPLVFAGSTTVRCNLVSASIDGPRQVGVMGQGIASEANPSSPVTVLAQPATRLVALFPGETRQQGKYLTAPYGKSGPPAPQLVGHVTTVTVYGVDAYYNTDTSANLNITADLYTDAYDSNPGTQALVNGATEFQFTPVTASTQDFTAGSVSLPVGTSHYTTGSCPSCASGAPPLPVWWGAPEKLQVVAEGQKAAPGKWPYDSDPTMGGRSITSAAPLTAGNTTTLTVNLVDHYFNVVRGTTPFMSEVVLPVSSYTPVVELAFPTDPNIQARGLAPAPYRKSLENGTTSFTAIPVTRGTDFRLRAADTKLTGTSYSTDTVAGITVNANAAVALQVLVPPETPAEGTLTGKGVATPGPLTAGSPYDVTVRAVDLYWNKANSGRYVKLGVNDGYADVPARQPLAAGEYTFSGFIPSASTANLTVTVEDDSGATPLLASQTTSQIVVNVGSPAKLMVMLPNELRVPGKNVAPFGVNGAVFVATAGVNFMPTVFVADGRYNWVAGVAQYPIQLLTDDPADSDGILGEYAMTNGSFTVPSPGPILYTAGGRTLSARDADTNAPALPDSAARSIVVNPNTPTKLRTLLPTCPPPGVCPPETRVSGPTGNGRVAAPLTTAAGKAVTITVDITDGFWNLVPGATQEVRLVCDDPFAVVVPTTQVISASATYSVTFKRAGTSKVWAELVDPLPDPPWAWSLAKDTATAVTVTAGAAERFLIKLPGEDFEMGSGTGKRGTPNPDHTAGETFSVTIGLVDAYFNLVKDRAAEASLLIPSDGFAPYVSTVAINTDEGYTDPITVSLRRAATGHYLVAREYSATGIADDPKSSTFTVLAAAPMGLQLVLPGQTAQPGGGDYPNGGISGRISTPTAGTPFTAAVNLVDRYLNVNTEADEWRHVYFYSSDAYDIEPATQPMSNGTLPVTFNLVTKTTSAVISVYPDDQEASRVCTANANPYICQAGNAAARTPKFKVWASTAVQLQVLLPGESLAPGKCDYQPGVVCRVLGAQEGVPGKSSSPANFLIAVPQTSLLANVYLLDKFWNVATERPEGAANQDTNPPAVMPKVQVTMPSDPAAALPSAQTLGLGLWSFPVSPLTALSTYTVAAATTSDSPVAYSSGTSSQFWVLPGPAHHMHFSGVPALIQAGIKFSATLSVHDQYHNLLSTGPNAYRGSVQFAGEVFGGNQDPTFSPPTVLFSSSVDRGQRVMTDLATLRKAGTCPVGGPGGGRWILAFDMTHPEINTEVEPYSHQPCVTVTPGPSDSVQVSPLSDVEVPAGSQVPDAPGFKEFTGQLTDAFDNPIVDAEELEVAVVDVHGNPGHLTWYAGATPVHLGVGVSTTVTTDSDGRVGFANKLAYFVSSQAGDSVRVWVGTQAAPGNLTPYINAKKNISGSLITVGGTPSKLVFVTSPTAATVGINEVAGAGAEFVLERRDDFDNVTRLGDSIVALKVDQTAAHTANHRSLGLFGNSGDYGFRDEANSSFISGFTIYE